MAASLTPSERSLRARMAAHAGWANTPDPSARTKPGRDKFLARFEAEVRAEHPDWTDEQVCRAAEHRRKAYFTKLAFRSARARRRKGAA